MPRLSAISASDNILSCLHTVYTLAWCMTSWAVHRILYRQRLYRCQIRYNNLPDFHISIVLSIIIVVVITIDRSNNCYRRCHHHYRSHHRHHHNRFLWITNDLGHNLNRIHSTVDHCLLVAMKPNAKCADGSSFSFDLCHLVTMNPGWWWLLLLSAAV